MDSSEGKAWVARADYLASLEPPAAPVQAAQEWTATAEDYTALAKENDALCAKLAEAERLLRECRQDVEELLQVLAVDGHGEAADEVAARLTRVDAYLAGVQHE